MTRSTELVGRGRELHVLSELVHRLRPLRPPVVAVVVGEPGIGKSRLLQEMATQPGQPDILEVAGFVPEQQVALASARRLLQQLGVWDRAHRSPRPSDRSPARGETPNLAPLFEAAFQEAHRRAPLLITVDDLQWVDDASIALLHYLVRAAEDTPTPLAVLAAGRPSPRVSLFAESLRRVVDQSERFTTMTLGALDPDAARTLARSRVRNATEAQVDEWCAQAEGSPFWLEALANPAGSGEQGGDVVTARIAGLGRESQQLLVHLAVVGRPVAAISAAALMDWSSTRFEDALDQLAALGLIAETGATVAIAHDLLRVAALEIASPETISAAHRRVAEWLEDQAASDVHLLLEALEHRHAAGLGSEDLAARILRSNRRHLLGADGFARLAAIGSASQTWRHQRDLARLAAELGLHDAAFELASELALAGRQESSDAALAASIAALHLDRGAEAWKLLDRATDDAEADAVHALRREAQRSRLLRIVDRRTKAGYEAATAALDRARALRADTPRGRRLAQAYEEVLTAAIEAALELDRPAELLALCDELAEATVRRRDPNYGRTLARAGLALRHLGRNADAERRLQKAWSEARRRVYPDVILEAGAFLANVLVALGRLDEAADLVEQCISLDQRLAGLRPGRALSIVFPHLVDALDASWLEAADGLEIAAAAEDRPHYRQRALTERALILARFNPRKSVGEIRQAVEMARTDATQAGCPRCHRETMLRAAEVLARIGDVDEARSFLREADETTQEAREGMSPLSRWWAGRAEASIAAAQGKVPAARGALVEVIAEAEHQGLLIEAVWARIDLGLMLAATDRPQAAALLQRAGSEAESMGAVNLAGLAERGLRRLGARTWRRGPEHLGAGLDRLTERELTIARLIGLGSSNPEIADELFLSRKTVERHVTNILAKLGARNRTEIGVLAAERPQAEGSPR